ncbi:MAG TPA: hypothetical protein VGS19_12170 [Streptosporangiaceae bacterium]|nr:hypothetical protein [Streptosporangiaceae bacterium]
MSESTDSGSTDSGGGWGEGLLETAEGALDATGHFIENAAEEGAKAFEAAGATAEDAANLVGSDAEAIPVLGEAVSIGETAYHAGAAIGSAITGDWDGAADHAGSMAESALSAATGGVTGMMEGAFDIGNAAGGGGEGTSAHHEIMSGLEAAGNWLGDEAYNLVHGDDSSATSTPSDAGSSSGGDPTPDAGTDPGSYDDGGGYDPSGG